MFHSASHWNSNDLIWDKNHRIQCTCHFVDNRATKRYFNHNGQRNGKYIEYDGSYLKLDRFYSNGKLDGTSRAYFSNGKLMEEAYYKDGLREGISKYYDREGILKLQYEYKGGQLIKK